MKFPNKFDTFKQDAPHRRPIRAWQQQKFTIELSNKHIRSMSATTLRKQRLRALSAVNRKWLRQDNTVETLQYRRLSFQEVIRPVLILAQVFALMPVNGITSVSVGDLSFSFCNIRTIYSLLVIACFGIISGYVTAFVFRTTVDFDSIESIIFYTSIFLIACAFFNLARKWPYLMQEWDQVEQTLPMITDEEERDQLGYYVKMIILVATLCSLIEHILSMFGIIYYVSKCPVYPERPVDSFLSSSCNQLFYFIEYRTWLGIICKVLNVFSTFAWNFIDIFLMAISVALSTRFKQLNEHMLNPLKRPSIQKFWTDNRINYHNLCKLCDTVDDAITRITFLCFSNNLYFICSKILKSLQKKPSLAHTIYFWYSLGFLLLRTFLLSLFTSEINEQSKRPLQIFRTISRHQWIDELKRFSEEVNADVVALSGMKFFRLTRSLVLSVGGTIITYELVLLQFVKQDRVNDCYEE